MCSTLEARLAMLRAAIDEVALAARSGQPGHAEPGDLAERLAGLWGMIAELDPALTARLRGYGPDTGLCARTTAPRLPLVGRNRGRGGPGARAPGQIPRAHGEAGRRPASMVSRLGGRQFPTISISIVAVTSGCSRTRTWCAPMVLIGLGTSIRRRSSSGPPAARWCWVQLPVTRLARILPRSEMNFRSSGVSL